MGTMSKTIYNPKYNRLTLWLREQRKEKGYTMRELADRLQVSHSYIGKVEQNERRLDILEYVKYCEALEIEPKNGLMILQKI